MEDGLYRPPGYTGLMEMMAEAMAIDLDRHVNAGTLAESTIDRMKMRCALCEQPRACEQVLSDPSATLPPDFCVNRQILAALATETQKRH